VCRAALPVANDALFRKRVDMGRHNYGRGRYAYFADPVPGEVQSLRAALFERLSPIANRMMALLGEDKRFPPGLDAYRRHCAAAGQGRPTPLLLEYRTDDFNNLHRDIYGGEFFPLQATALLSRPGDDFEGGEFVLVENRARQQARATVVPLRQGEIVVFPGDLWPAAGRRGPVRARMRHGVSSLTAGHRMALGLIFHDAA
jgi:hypothetical protein